MGARAHPHPVAPLQLQQPGEEADPLVDGIDMAGQHSRAERVANVRATAPPADLANVIWHLEDPADCVGRLDDGGRAAG